MAIAFVQASPGALTIGATSSSDTFGSNTTAGSLLVVTFNTYAAQGRTITVTDTQGNTYALAATQTCGSGSQAYLYYAMNTVGGACTVTAACSGGAINWRLGALEYSGAATTSALDQTATATGTGTVVSAGSVTTTIANAVLVVSVSAYSLALDFTAGSGYTEQANWQLFMFGEDRVVSATGTYAGDGTLSSPGDEWVALLAAFADTPVGGPVVPPPLARLFVN